MTSSGRSFTVWIKWAGASALALLFFTGARPAFAQDNWEIYRNAIKDAATYNRNKVLPLRLLKDEGGKVLVVTYTNYAYPDPPYPKPYHIPDGVYIWVTGEGEVQTICKQFHLSGDPLRLRLDQLLGLKPDTSYTTFVVLSVPADRVFRPSPDPNPATVLPCADPADKQCGNVFPSSVPSDHFSFFAKQSTGAYRIGQDPSENEYPWTHLGYTYDWFPYAATKYGASEYVIKPGTEATIVSKSTMNQYCNAP
jgi:hypothetical protein